jgi:hypothetical protein
MATKKIVKTNSPNGIPPSAKFTLVLSKLKKGTSPVLPNARCTFSYNWDFQKNMGLAHLISIDGSIVEITLHPLGIQGYLDFMSSMPPTPFVINGKKVIIYRVILDINLQTGVRSAAIMFNVNGSVIQTSALFTEASLDKLA